MDEKTLAAYKNLATPYSDDWLAQPRPDDMYSVVEKFFSPGGKTADIGCGNGRDAHWMSENGFQVQGFDSSPELLKIAQKLYPKVEFKPAFLPQLKEITQKFSNVLCETVIMHLPVSDIPDAIDSLKRILDKNGALYLSWRVTEDDDARHADGRLYSAFQPDFILSQFDMRWIVHFEDQVSLSSGKRICRLVYKSRET